MVTICGVKSVSTAKVLKVAEKGIQFLNYVGMVFFEVMRCNNS